LEQELWEPPEPLFAPPLSKADEISSEAAELAEIAMVCAGEVLCSNAQDGLERLKQIDRRLQALECALRNVVAQSSGIAAEEMETMLSRLRTTDELRRIGSCAVRFASRARTVSLRLRAADVHDLAQMCMLLQQMLESALGSLNQREPTRQAASSVVRKHKELERLRDLLLTRHTEAREAETLESLHVLSMANALDRAGDYIGHLAEPLCLKDEVQTASNAICTERLFIQSLKQHHRLQPA
jgi:Na+/phosphate symporter